jgi:ACS family hexuronate transporter-like MFS transporter
MFTIASDMFPRHAVASVVGLGGMAGAVGGMLIATATGWLLQVTGSYLAIFLVAGSTYLVALLLIHALKPDLKPAELSETPA